ncbi:helix-turn-helix domain-containing protein [Serratia marcescens]|uniref:LexA family protein n=1 Tax=Serratia marcescens TaxID=615 RepID=UPI0018822EC7|nr:helix-turn-helix domain-containing protein [Serratia marcescens]HBL7110031.1 helix-turn-helix domain-containing protein [Serratia marcescens]HBL7332000.1 helix-turn-helix domain-containing protein [Serratia marcescens]
MNMKWYEAAKAKMKESRIGQEQLAEHLGVTKGAVSHWLNGRREPGIEIIANIMNFIGLKDFVVNPGNSQPASHHTETSNVKFAGPYKKSREYPLISWVQAGAWAEAMEPYTVDEIDEWFESDAKVFGKAFWLRVDGDSMTAPTGISIPEGTLVLIDTGREAVNGSLVIAKMVDANEATFKKLIIDGGQKYLKGLNPAWPMKEINGNCKIIGVAIQTMMRLV